MLTNVASASISRLSEVRSFLRLILRLGSGTSVSIETRTLKGLFFVHLYGAYEYTVTEAVQVTLAAISARGHQIKDFRHAMLGVVLDAECRSLAGTGVERTWAKRQALFNKVASSDIAQIDSAVLPTGSGNLRYKNLEEIWHHLCVCDPIVPRSSIIGRLNETVDNRNAIAHGRETPADVGRRYTPADLEQIWIDVDELCAHLVACLDSYLQRKDYLL